MSRALMQTLQGAQPLLYERQEADVEAAVRCDSGGLGRSDTLESMHCGGGDLSEGLAFVIHKWCDFGQTTSVPEPHFPHL